MIVESIILQEVHQWKCFLTIWALRCSAAKICIKQMLNTHTHSYLNLLSVSLVDFCYSCTHWKAAIVLVDLIDSLYPHYNLTLTLILYCNLHKGPTQLQYMFYSSTHTEAHTQLPDNFTSSGRIQASKQEARKEGTWEFLHSRHTTLHEKELFIPVCRPLTENFRSTA